MGAGEERCELLGRARQNAPIAANRARSDG